MSGFGRDTSEIKKDVLTSNNDRSLFQELDVFNGFGVVPVLHNCVSPTMLIAMHRRDIPNEQTIPVCLDAIIDNDGRFALRTSQFNGLNFDNYVSGCNLRVSAYGLNEDRIAYFINKHHGKTAIRQIDIKGSASMGEFDIVLSSDTSISGSVGVNSSMRENIEYVKNIGIGEFDISVSNCSVAGFIADVESNQNLLSSDKLTVVTGDSNIIDGDLTSSYYEITSGNAGSHVLSEISFESLTGELEFNSICYSQEYDNYTSPNWSIRFQVNAGGVWTTIKQHNFTDYDVWHYAECHVSGNYTDVTGFRIYISAGSSLYDFKSYVYDMAVCEV